MADNINLQAAVVNAAIEWDSSSGRRDPHTLAQEIKVKFPDEPVTETVLVHMIFNVVRDM